MEFLTDTLFTEFGRSDYIGGIDNEALDFGQLDQFIHVTTNDESQTPSDSIVPNSTAGIQNGNSGNGQNTGGSVGAINNCSTFTSSATTAVTINNVTTASTSQTHLPESPPDSGSEPPYSPTDLQGLTIVGPASAGTSSLHQRNGHHHGQQQQSPGLSSANVESLTELSQATIDLHHSHLSLLNTQHHPHHHQPHQKHSLQHHTNVPSYIRDDHNGNEHQHLHHSHHQEQQSMAGLSEITICKHEDMLLQDPESLILHHQHNSTNLLENFRNDLTHGNLLHIGQGPLNSDDLSRLMPTDVYSTTTPIPTSTISIRPCQLTPTPTSVSISSSITASRKRKLSQPDVSGPSLVKPEPSSSLSPMCHQHLDQADSPISSTLQNLSLPSCTPEASNAGSNNSIGDIGTGQNPETTGGGGGSGSSSSGEPCPLQCIRFSPFQQQNWHILCNQSLQELPLPYYNVDADKGFNFSNSDDAFVCQKKNHFQITCHAKLHGNAVFVRTSSGLEKIKSFHLHFYGVKLEAPNHTIRIEQSQSDRSKKPFHPVLIDLQNDVVSKITVVRLHFSETTSNNMRKKGRPNPEQRYFQLVVGLHAHTHSGHFPIISHGSERIIVRASNPGQFESDVELCWQRGVTQDSIFHAGRVGINTDRPDESLVVHGNLKVSGHIVQPSDSRAKQEIKELDTSEQLRNLQKIRIVKYRYEPDFAIHSGLKDEDDDEEIIDTGVIAQEVRQVLPDAVQEAGNIVLSNGQVIEKFLLVNKDRILMENIGAVKELCKVTGSLETRIEQLEKINSRLIRIQQLDRDPNGSTPKCKHIFDDDDDPAEEICSNKTIQKIIIILVIIMAICLLAISALYFVEHRQHYMSTSASAILSREQIYNSNIKKQYPSDRQHQYHYPQQDQQHSLQQDEIKTRFGTNYPIGAGDILGNDVDEYLVAMKKDQKTSATTMIIINNNQLPIGPDYDTDSLAPAPPGDETSSEKISEMNISNLPPNSFEGERIKKVVKGKSKSSLAQSSGGGSSSGATNGNAKKSQYQQSAQHSQQDLRVQQTQQVHVGTNEQHIDNKNHQDAAAEDQDLQYLSNNNDSDDQFSVENTVQASGSNFVVLNRTISAIPIGVPSLCQSVKTETIECQSVCCEESNRLLDSIDFTDTNPNLNRTTGSGNGMATNNANEKDTFLSNTSTSSLCTSSTGLQPNNKVDSNPPLQPLLNERHNHQAPPFEVGPTIEETGTILEEHEQASKLKRKASSASGSDPITDVVDLDLLVDGEGQNSNRNVTLNNDSNRPTSSDNCYPIIFFIRSESFNTSAGKEVICLNAERRQNIIYTIPISKYMRETKLEFHFFGPNTLQWSLCTRKEGTATGSVGSGGGYLKKSPPIVSDSGNNIDDNGGIFQLSPSKSIFHLHLPSYGYFEKRFELRAGFDVKSTCQDQVDESSNLLQYNIRVFRDCD